MIKRDRRASHRAELNKYLSSINYRFQSWLNITVRPGGFYDVIATNWPRPPKEIKISVADAPWINHRLKTLIKRKRQALFTYGVN